MKFAITFLFATLCLPGEAQQRFHQATLHARDSILALMQASMIPGLSVTVSVEGETVWSEGFGFSDLEQKVKVDPARTRFRIGSISKSLTAAGLGRLYENNKIFPDSSIYFYLPDYPRLKYRPTVRQVAGHIGGVRHYRGNEFFIASHYRTVQEGLGIFKNDTLLFPPGTKYQYSSYGYNLVSAILEKAAGTDFLSFMNKEVFDPLELNHTSADVNDSIIDYRARCYDLRNRRWVNAPYVDNSYKWAGGGFISTSEDICRFGNAMLGSDYLNQETITELIRSQHLSDGSPTGYGMGFGSGKDMNGHAYFGHTGGSVGGTSHLLIYPEEQIVVVILTNLSSARLRQMAYHIARLYME